MIDHLLWRATLLGLLLIVSAVASALAYRYLTRRILRQPAKDALTGDFVSKAKPRRLFQARY